MKAAFMKMYNIINENMRAKQYEYMSIQIMSQMNDGTLNMTLKLVAWVKNPILSVIWTMF